jgi:hypothetical protein
MKDTIDDAPVPFVARFKRHDRPRALTILVTPTSASDLGDLVRFRLAARPFIRDVICNRILAFWQMMTPEGAYLLLLPTEEFETFEELALQEVRFVSDELARHRLNPPAAPALSGVC